MTRNTLLTLACALTLAACNDGPDKGTTTNTGSGSGGSWAVGQRGAMVRLDPEGDIAFYPLEIDDDLRAIACKGHEQAVVAGAGGVVLTTVDAGVTWNRIDIGGSAELRAVALSEGDRGYIVGDGVALRTQDDSLTWETLPIDPHDWSAVATNVSGKLTLLTSAAGDIYRLDETTTLTQVHAGDGSVLTGVALTPDGQHAVAVGQAGLLLRSDDAGTTWRAELPATTRDLHAVRIAGDASLILAVGQAGTVVRIAQDDTAVSELLDPALSLRAIHLSQSHGHAVGDDGVMFSTHDHGRTWEPIALGLEQDLLGLDDLHGEPHL
jgi:photosystem II stability/assembly factor-like uncharacterized protein